MSHWACNSVKASWRYGLLPKLELGRFGQNLIFWLSILNLQFCKHEAEETTGASTWPTAVSESRQDELWNGPQDEVNRTTGCWGKCMESWKKVFAHNSLNIAARGLFLGWVVEWCRVPEARWDYWLGLTWLTWATCSLGSTDKERGVEGLGDGWVGVSMFPKIVKKGNLCNFVGPRSLEVWEAAKNHSQLQKVDKLNLLNEPLGMR